MNERIQQLAEQARQYAIQKIENSQDPTEWSTAMFEQKFAELIVRECYEHCKGEMMDKKTAEEAGLNYNDGVMDCAIGLLQHFGVK